MKLSELNDQQRLVWAAIVALPSMKASTSRKILAEGIKKHFEKRHEEHYGEYYHVACCGMDVFLSDDGSSLVTYTVEEMDRLKDIGTPVDGATFPTVSSSVDHDAYRYLRSIGVDESEFGHRYSKEYQHVRNFIESSVGFSPTQSPSIGEMRTYCLEWCKRLEIPHGHFMPIGGLFKCRYGRSDTFTNETWLIRAKYSEIRIQVTKGMNDGETVIAYSVIRAIERGEMGGVG